MELEKGELPRFAPLEHWREQQQVVSQELNDLARGHEERSNGFFTTLPIDPERYAGQKITAQTIDGTPKPIPELVKLGEAVSGEHPERFIAILNAFKEAEERQELVTSLGEDLSIGQNIIVITNHCRPEDIAKALGAAHISIKEVGEANQREYDFTTNLMMSKMMAHTAVYGTPVVEHLQSFCDTTYLSFPRTDSIRGTRIPELLVDAYNWQLRRNVRNRFAEDTGSLFGIAPSGTVDKPTENGDPSIIRLGRAEKGTVKILTSANTKVLPIAVYESENEFIFEILGTPRHMRDADDVHDTMESIAAVLTKSSSQKEFTYKRSSE